MKNNPYDHISRVLPALAISAIGALFYNVLPLYVGASQDSLSLAASEVGLLTAAFFAGYNLVTATAFFWIRRWSWRKATALWLPLSLLAMVLGIYVSQYWLLLSITAVAGGGFAAIYGIGTTILADTSDPARWYGIKIALETVPGAVLLFVLPTYFIPDYGIQAVILGIVIMSVLLSLALKTLPSSGALTADDPGQPALEEPTFIPGANPLAVWLALLATLLFFSAASGMWAFVERLGVSFNFDSASIGHLLAITLVFATLGSLTTAWVGKRFGNVKPFIVGVGLFLAALSLLWGQPEFLTFSTGTCLLTFAIGMGLPFAIAEVAELDQDGRYIVLSVPAIGLGAMIGPALAGILANSGSFDPVILAASAAMILSAAGITCGAMIKGVRLKVPV